MTAREVDALAEEVHGADLRDLVPLLNGSSEAYTKLNRGLVSSEHVITADELEFMSLLGRGGFGCVYKCRYSAPPGTRRAELVSENGGLVAVKHLKTRQQMLRDRLEKYGARGPGDDEDSLTTARAFAFDDFVHEVLVLRKLIHPNVIGYIGCGVFADADGDEELALVLEYAAHGSLEALLEVHQGQLARHFTETEGMKWANEIASGMAFLHTSTPTICHRDLKPANVLICGTAKVAKVCDFGLASFEIERRKNAARETHINAARQAMERRERQRMREEGDRMAAEAEAEAELNAHGGGLPWQLRKPPPLPEPNWESFHMTAAVGSLRYMAPENFRGDDYTHKVDVYSFGMIMFELFLRQHAEEQLRLHASQVARNAARRHRPKIPEAWPPEVVALVEACWNHDPNLRPEFSEVDAIMTAWRTGPNASKLLHQLAVGSKRSFLEKIGVKRTC